jgi:hypothetical protein
MGWLPVRATNTRQPPDKRMVYVSFPVPASKIWGGTEHWAGWMAFLVGFARAVYSVIAGAA